MKSHQYSAYLLAKKQDREAAIVEEILLLLPPSTPLKDKAGLALMFTAIVSGEYEHLQHLSPLYAQH